MSPEIAPTLVTWGEFSRPSMIKGSQWAGPGGRELYLEGREFREEYLATEVRDFRSYEVPPDADPGRRFDPVQGKDIEDCILPGQPLPLSKDRELSSVRKLPAGTQTTIQPARVEESDPRYHQRLATYARITPDAQELAVSAKGVSEELWGATTQVDIWQNQDGVAGEMNLSLDTSRLVMKLDADGLPTLVELTGGGLLLAMAGINKMPHFSYGRATITHPATCLEVLSGMAARLDGPRGVGGVDMQETAKRFYDGMGAYDFKPTEEMAFAG
ncbi:MAG TPA: hypothetical protein VK674_07035 [Candidatus Limnocylindria bacterium]|nr:hypothetical protein [Candidatus Limnocylindria bacterium]